MHHPITDARIDLLNCLPKNAARTHKPPTGDTLAAVCQSQICIQQLVRATNKLDQVLSARTAYSGLEIL